MSPPAINITLLLPAFPIASQIPDVAMVPTSMPDTGETDVLARQYAQLMWGCAQTNQEPWQSQLLPRLGLSAFDGQHLPAARIRFHDAALSGTIVSYRELIAAGLACADPVHLQADHDSAKLYPIALSDLSSRDAGSLLETLNEFLKQDNVQLIRDPDSRWYIAGLDAQSLASYPPSFLAHRNAAAFMPEGDDKGRWRRLMTELQML